MCDLLELNSSTEIMKATIADKRIQPAVSVVVPVYNIERFLKQCVESLLGQSMRDI